MSRTIKLEDKVYQGLDDLRGKGETFSDAVQSLLFARQKLIELIAVLERPLKVREWQRENSGRPNNDLN